MYESKALRNAHLFKNLAAAVGGGLLMAGILGSADGAEKIWTVTEKAGELEISSPAVAFEADAARGGRIQNLRWKKSPLALQQMQPVLHTGILYDSRQLNKLAEGARGGEAVPLTWKIEGDVLLLEGEFRVHDLTVSTVYTIQGADGSMKVAAKVGKSGPGSIKAQIVWMLSFAVQGTGPSTLQADFVSGGKPESRSEFGTEGEVLDQDGHSSNRFWLLSSPEVFFHPPEIGNGISAQIDEAMSVLAFLHRPLDRNLIAQLYGADRMLAAGETMTSTLSLGAGSRPADALPKLVNDPDKELTSALANESRPIAPGTDPGEAVTTYRRNLHAWLLEEASWYLSDGHPDEARGLLADARRVRQALEAGEPANLPRPGRLLYENSFRQWPDDWLAFGFGELKSDPEEGLYMAPNTTMNLWSEQEFSGDYMVEFEYRPEISEKKGRGTFLQLGGRSVNPRDPVDFMASATGRMPDYNFGIACYHFSFNRQAPERARTNFRKTGTAFRLLALTERATASEPQWHRVTAVKRGTQFLFFINGEFVLEYFDEANRGPLYDKGHLGLRNWGGMKAWFRNFRVHALTEKAR